jgi:hypothetical protein
MLVIYDGGSIQVTCQNAAGGGATMTRPLPVQLEIPAESVVVSRAGLRFIVLGDAEPMCVVTWPNPVPTDPDVDMIPFREGAYFLSEAPVFDEETQLQERMDVTISCAGRGEDNEVVVGPLRLVLGDVNDNEGDASTIHLIGGDLHVITGTALPNLRAVGGIIESSGGVGASSLGYTGLLRAGGVVVRNMPFLASINLTGVRRLGQLAVTGNGASAASGELDIITTANPELAVVIDAVELTDNTHLSREQATNLLERWVVLESVVLDDP